MVAYPSIGLSHFGGYQVFTSSLAREEEIKNVDSFGGFGVVNIDKENLVAVIKNMEESIVCSDFMKSEARKLAPGYVIMVQSIIFEYLSPEDVVAILMHEIGHIKLGHLVSPPKSKEEFLMREKEADAYSAGVVGKENYKRAFENLVAVLENLGLREKDEIYFNERVSEFK